MTLWNISSHSPQLERLAAEGGAPAKLLDAMCNGDEWPPSLRDMAAGCLGFFAERHSNLGLFPSLDLPEEVLTKWPLQVSFLLVVSGA